MNPIHPKGGTATLLLTTVLMACTSSPVSQPKPAVPALSDILGLVQVQVSGLGDATPRIQTRFLQVSDALSSQSFTAYTGSTTPVQFTKSALSFSDQVASGANTRFVSTVLDLQNNSSVNFDNLTLVALNYPSITEGGSAVGQLKNASDAAVSSPAAVARSFMPTHAMVRKAGAMVVQSGQTSLQVFSSSEVATMASAFDLAVPTLVGESMLGYGFVAQNLSGGRSIGANGCTLTPNCNKGEVALNYRFPRTAASRAEEPWSFTLVFALINDSTTTTTQSLEEQNDDAGVQARASNLGASGVRTLAGSSYSGPGRITVGGAQTAVPALPTYPQGAWLGSAPTAPTGALAWSNPDTWGGTVPAETDSVTIPAGKKLLLDRSVKVKNLTVNGSLEFAEQDLELTGDYLMLHGKLNVGSATQPFTHKATLTFTGQSGENIMGMGTRGILNMGGTLELFGAAGRTPWTRLSTTAAKGATQITVDAASSWKVGDRIAVASTDYDFAQAEEFTLSAVSGNTLTLSAPLKYDHFGQAQSFGGKTLESRAEVALLSRNITVQGDATSDSSKFGAQVMTMDGGQAHIDGVEFARVGQKKASGRYPVHFHLLGDAGANSYVKNSSIHNSYNRCLTIHGTNGVKVQNNAAFETVGHCYFLEDGVETGNLLEGNLAFGVHKPADADRLLPTDGRPSAFWITNPNNVVRNNVAAGVEWGVGFWYALPEKPMGLSSGVVGVFPRHTPLGEFSGNLAHSSGDTGLDVDHGPDANGNMTGNAHYEALTNPADDKSAVVTTTFSNFSAYKNRTRGVWLRGTEHRLVGAVLADSAIGATFASDNSYIQDSVLIGETANKGNPQPWEKVGPDGRSLPFPWDDASDPLAGGYKYPIRGFEFYDGLVGAKNVTFVNYTANANRQAGALSYLRNNRFSIVPQNFLESASFQSANPVYLETPHADRDGDLSATFVDTQGALSGTAGQSVVVNNPFLKTATCTLKSEWNSLVCPSQYTSFGIERVGGSGGIVPLKVARADGTLQTLSGTEDGAVSSSVWSTVIRNAPYDVTPTGTQGHWRVHLRNSKIGDWLRVSLPWSAGVNVYRDWWIDNRNRLIAASSLADLDASSGDKYWLGGGKLYLKLQVKNEPNYDWAALEVCSSDLCS